MSTRKVRIQKLASTIKKDGPRVVAGLEALTKVATGIIAFAAVLAPKSTDT